MRAPILLALVLAATRATPAHACKFRPPAPAEEPRTVVLVPLGPVDAAMLKTVADAVEARVHARVRVDAPRPLPKDAWYAPRRRWRAEAILAALEEDPPPGAWKVLAVTDAEISTTKGGVADWGIGGYAGIGMAAGVVSTHIHRRHAKSRAVLHRRMTDLAVHEFGHLLGLMHCNAPRCTMRDAKGRLLNAADTSTMEYCGMCRARVERGVLKTRL